MKTVIEEQQATPEWKFPCLAKSNSTGDILYVNSGSGDNKIGGILIHTDDGSNLGFYSGGWNINAFTPITTPLTITFIPE